ncbi:amidohydrolase family protein [Chitinophaga alhagiae]|uniref:amidohydrolase family protein n=1 Tax=Chitinophaga alhagiae TaxID=2203219 RepID=UPI000E5A757E|nr:amidohydrolase family protein [Chitinophaga alhagiae]
MLIDVNAWVGHWPFKRLHGNTCEGLLARMKEYGTDVSVVTNLHGIFYKNTQSANEELYEEVHSKRAYKDRFIPFAVINPIYGGWRDDFEVSVKKLGMKGIRVFPNYHDYTITEPALLELVKMARDHNLPVALTMRMVDERQRSWMDLATEWAIKDYLPLLQAVPDAKYMLLNLSTGVGLSAEEEALLKGTDVLFDTSGRHIGHLAKFAKRFGEQRFAFGTHFPVLDYYTGLLRIDSLREEEGDKEQYRYRNAQRFLGL